MKSVLYEKYKTEVVPQLMASRAYGNVMQVPRLEKIVISTGVGTAKDREVLASATETLAAISGQKPVVTKSRKSISNFKLREGMNVGAMVTLRHGVMYNFMYRLTTIAMPRVRDFRGVPKRAFDGAGNYTFGLADQSVFPEVDLDRIKHTIGMNITFVTTAQTDDEARELLTLLGMPFEN
jgi:large subunit ribosomal protein L5